MRVELTVTDGDKTVVVSEQTHAWAFPTTEALDTLLDHVTRSVRAAFGRPQVSEVELARLKQELARPTKLEFKVDKTSLTEPLIERTKLMQLLDSAWCTVWLRGNWRQLTQKMTPEQREAVADAVDRNRERDDSDAPPISRWWRDDVPTIFPPKTGGEVTEEKEQSE